jgi:hypothetical protein
MTTTPIDRFWAKVDLPADRTQCWLWRAATIRGYGSFRVAGQHHYAHRFAYELLVGPIADGLTIDHLCRRPLCVNPSHMEPVTRAENRARAPISGAAKQHAAKTRCDAGHPLIETNLLASSSGGRRCKICARRRREACRERQRAKGLRVT